MADVTRDIEYKITVKDEATKALGDLRAAALGATAALAGIATSIKFAADFEKGMKEVATLSKDVEANLTGISDEVLKLSSEMGIDAVEAAGAMYQAISAGVPAQNAVEFLEIASKAAIGGVTDLETAVDGITSVLNAFKMETSDASKVSDIMFTAVKLGKTTFEELSASVFNVAPIAAAAGVSFEEVAAAIALMTAQGTPTSVATTQIRAGIQGLLKPTEELTELAKKWGFENMQALISSEGLTAALGEVVNATQGNIGEMTKMLGSIEAVQAALVLTGDAGEDMWKVFEQMATSAGATQEAFDLMSSSVSFKFAKMSETVKNFMITIGTQLLPIVNKILDAITPVIAKMSEWISAHPKLAGAIVAAIAVMSAFIIAVTSVIAAIAIIAGILSGPFVTAVIFAGAAIGIFVGTLIAKFDELKIVFAALRDFFKLVWLGIKTVFEEGAGVIGEVWESMLTNMKDRATERLDEIKQTFKDAFTILKENMLAFFDFLKEIPGNIGRKIGIGNTRGRQRGGFVGAGETTIVGETGPEAVTLPQGSFVHPAGETSRRFGGGGVSVNINVQGSLIGLSQRELADMVGQQVLRSLGSIVSKPI